jgi:hypothetical protein
LSGALEVVAVIRVLMIGVLLAGSLYCLLGIAAGDLSKELLDLLSRLVNVELLLEHSPSGITLSEKLLFIL